MFLPVFVVVCVRQSILFFGTGIVPVPAYRYNTGNDPVLTAKCRHNTVEKREGDHGE